ncbi:hypothetical protein CPT_Pollock15 [Escherichia phage Pollock]|uniref:Uncharacterized protein n=1 Tax=Escherichia phage Pollock TaxID=1540097 RepID=A0A0A0YPU1_9CAUD|nr:hypothetical protein ACQ44_gp15 [Escherichia phage Pollock]AIX12374.1 hypothetical protein CPT_Pollock15 [Escherichia phage Pollock]
MTDLLSVLIKIFMKDELIIILNEIWSLPEYQNIRGPKEELCRRITCTGVHCTNCPLGYFLKDEDYVSQIHKILEVINHEI